MLKLFPYCTIDYDLNFYLNNKINLFRKLYVLNLQN